MQESAEKQSSEAGSALIVMVVLMVSVGGLVMAHLGEVRSSQRLVWVRQSAERAEERALGELDRAKNIVNTAPYKNNVNTAIWAGLNSDPPFIPGTEVEVEPLGDAAGLWYRLRAVGEFQGINKTAQAFCRMRSPVSAYNFFVVDHPLGISGAPRGAIHSNKKIQFYFPNGTYRDEVTAGEGFEYKAGATAENTRLWGPYNHRAPVSNLLTDFDLSKLSAKAKSLAVKDELVAEVEFQGKQTQVKLFRPSYTMRVEKTGTRNVFDRYETRTMSRKVKRYKSEPYTKTVNVYRTHYINVIERKPVYAYRNVEKTKTEKVWIDGPPPSGSNAGGGSSVGGGGRYGYWKTRTVKYTVKEKYVSGYRNATVRKKVKTKIGTKPVTKYKRVFSHYETVTWTENVAVTRPETYTYYEDVKVEEQHVRTELVPTDGVIYVEKDIRKVSGKVNGRVSLVSNTGVKITDSIQYVDDHGNTRMLNGKNPAKAFEMNPDYKAPDNVLAIMSKGDILYSKDVPQHLEINAALISIDGKVAMEGIRVDSKGEVDVDKSIDSSYIKESVRRLGGIASRKRPVATFVDSDMKVRAGFKAGQTMMDPNMLVKGGGTAAPPSIIQLNRPVWAITAMAKAFPIQ